MSITTTSAGCDQESASEDHPPPLATGIAGEKAAATAAVVVVDAPPPSYSLRPAFERSILQPLFSTPTEALDCAEQLHLHLVKDDLFKSGLFYRIAHSQWYRRWFLVVTLFFTCTVILWQAPWMQRIEATCLILVVCIINLLCSLTRIDRSLLRALAETFEWPYLIIVLYTFISFNALTQQQDDTYGKVRETQWTVAQIHGFVQSIALCAPICFLLSNLDAIPLYPIAVKSGVLLCGLMIILRVLILDLRNYAWNGGTTTESTDFGLQHTICIGNWLCSTVKNIGNLFAGQVAFFLVRHAFITITALRGQKWKQMTILSVPLLIHPHFQPEAYEEAPSPKSTINTIHVASVPDTSGSHLAVPQNERTYTRLTLDRNTPLLQNLGSSLEPVAVSRRQSVRIITSAVVAPVSESTAYTPRRHMLSPITIGSRAIEDVPPPPPPPIDSSAMGLATTTHKQPQNRIDHRVKGRKSKEASEYAFEVGGYADVLHRKTLNPHEVIPWVFPVEFRPLNPVRKMRRWVWKRKKILDTWFFVGSTLNVVLFGILILLAAFVPSLTYHSAIIIAASLSAVAAVGSLCSLGATVSDRRILWHLVKTWEVWLTLYQALFCVTTTLLLPSQWFHWLCAWFWIALNAQIIFFDAAIWYGPLQKRTMIGLGLFLSFTLLAINVASHSSTDFTAAQTSCFITCTSLHASNVFSLLFATIFQLKYLFKIFKHPSGTIILSVPVLYVGEQAAPRTQTSLV